MSALQKAGAGLDTLRGIAVTAAAGQVEIQISLAGIIKRMILRTADPAVGLFEFLSADRADQFHTGRV